LLVLIVGRKKKGKSSTGEKRLEELKKLSRREDLKYNVSHVPKRGWVKKTIQVKGTYRRRVRQKKETFFIRKRKKSSRSLKK